MHVDSCVDAAAQRAKILQNLRIVISMIILSKFVGNHCNFIYSDN